MQVPTQNPLHRSSCNLKETFEGRSGTEDSIPLFVSTSTIQRSVLSSRMRVALLS